MESCARCMVHGVVHKGKLEKFRDVIREHWKLNIYVTFVTLLIKRVKKIGNGRN